MMAGQELAGGIVSVDVSSIRDLPVTAKNVTARAVKLAARAAKSDPEGAPPVLLGRVGGLLYPVNESEAVAGLREAGVGTVRAVIADYGSMRDLVVGHVRKNYQPHTIDPLRVREVVGYLVEGGMGADEACRELWLDRRPELLAAVSYEITDRARDILLSMAAEISKKVYTVVTPVYYVERISKIREDCQANAALELKMTAVSSMKREDSSLWPHNETIKTLLKSYPRKVQVTPAEDRITEMEKLESLNKKRRKEEREAARRRTPAKTAKKAAGFIGDDSNLIYVDMGGKAPDLVVHKKTGRVAEAREVEGVRSLVGDMGSPMHVMSPEIARYLGNDDLTGAAVCKYPTLAAARKALAKPKEEARCVVITFAKIPRR